jgi:hypothetical protein
VSDHVHLLSHGFLSERGPKKLFRQAKRNKAEDFVYRIFSFLLLHFTRLAKLVLLLRKTIKKWFAVLIEGMFYLYKYNLLHRNLKPSSVYITNMAIETNADKFELKIGAFGSIEIIRDARTKTRIRPRKAS